MPPFLHFGLTLYTWWTTHTTRNRTREGKDPNPILPSIFKSLFALLFAQMPFSNLDTATVRCCWPAGRAELERRVRELERGAWEGQAASAQLAAAERRLLQLEEERGEERARAQRERDQAEARIETMVSG